MEFENIVLTAHYIRYCLLKCRKRLTVRAKIMIPVVYHLYK